MNRKKWLQFRKRLAQVLEVGAPGDWVSRGYDLLSTLILLTNVIVTVLYTFDRMELEYGSALLFLEAVTVFAFGVDYVLRLIAARFMYPALDEYQALKRYIFSFSGMVDLLSFLPYYLPIFFPPVQQCFVCSGLSEFSGSSSSIPIMTH